MPLRSRDLLIGLLQIAAFAGGGSIFFVGGGVSLLLLGASILLKVKRFPVRSGQAATLIGTLLVSIGVVGALTVGVEQVVWSYVVLAVVFFGYLVRVRGNLANGSPR